MAESASRAATSSRPRCQADRALADGGKEICNVQKRGRPVRKPEALQAREREQRRIDLAALRLAEPGLDVAAQQRNLQIGPEALDLRLAPQRRRARCRRLVGRPAKVVAFARNKRVAHVFAWQEAGDDNAVGQRGRQILRRMHGDVNVAP